MRGLAHSFRRKIDHQYGTFYALRLDQKIERRGPDESSPHDERAQSQARAITGILRRFRGTGRRDFSVEFQRWPRFGVNLAGSFPVKSFFMSAGTRSCPAFFIAMDRSRPGGNFLASTRASDARASQS